MHSWGCPGMYSSISTDLPFTEWKISKLTSNEENHLLEPKAQVGGLAMTVNITSNKKRL